VFKKADGLSWMDSAGRTFTLSWAELRYWVGVRTQAGRLVPKGFPRSNSFGPAFWEIGGARASGIRASADAAQE
jgi:topoisomerase-4 subunit A